MAADLARITYDPTRQYRSVIAQQGRVTLEADISPVEINLTEARDQVKRTTVAQATDTASWEVANTTLLGDMSRPGLVIAFASAVASPPSSDLVGAVPADRFAFDTRALTPADQQRVEGARAILPSIRNCKGTAWIARDSGLLIKFNIDADFSDKSQHAWQEHYEGEVFPKPDRQQP